MTSKILGGPSAGPGICCLMVTSQAQLPAKRLLTMSGPFIDISTNCVHLRMVMTETYALLKTKLLKTQHCVVYSRAFVVRWFAVVVGW